MAKKWYVVHTYSGFENKVKKSLEDRIRIDSLDEVFGEILIPMESVVEMVKGEKKASKRKLFPGYILVQMEADADGRMDDRAKHVVKNTPKVTGFLGDQLNPRPVPDREVEQIKSQIQEGTTAPKPKVQFAEGDSVRVIDGPFSNFNGTIEEVQADKGKVRVQISIFGRATPVTLDFMQVEKT